jgi:arsenite-transporting ATPase
MAHPEELPLPLERSLPQLSSLPGGLKQYIDELAAIGHGVIMTMGKGGVGKTSVAAAIAFNLAERGFPVVLSTTDPAAHVAAAAADGIPGLTVTKIDPTHEVREYTEEVLEKAGKSLDAAGLAMLEEDLRSPCTEEIAVFRAFARTVDEGKGGFVVLDTAPTGHTILLLDAAESYHREVERTQGDMPESVKELLPRLRDKDFTHVFVVTLPEATPVHEAERLQKDLRRAGIDPFAWVINQSLLASGTYNPVLMERGAYELPYIETVSQKLSSRCALIPWIGRLPIGKEGLAALVT